MNHMIHIAAISQIRLDTDGRDLLPTQARRGQETTGSHQVSQAQDLRRHLSTAPHRRRTGSWHGSGRALRGDS